MVGWMFTYTQREGLWELDFFFYFDVMKYFKHWNFIAKVGKTKFNKPDTDENQKCLYRPDKREGKIRKDSLSFNCIQ